MRRLTAFVLILLCISNALAQESACPVLQAAAFENIIERCAEQEAGALCLGQATVSPVLRGSMSAARLLDEPGDAISIADIDWLSISSEDKTWGAARALFPAYSGDDLEARDAALLAFGNVALTLPEPAPQPPILADVKVTAAQGANLRARPGTDAPIIAKLVVSRELKAIARDRGGGWLMIYATPELRGWISRSVVSTPLERLPTLDADADTAPLWLPWNRFDFRSGIDDAPCEGAPESGILLQTAEFAAPRQFVINGARLLLSGTAWLQAQVSSGMLVHVLDGRGWLSGAGGEVVVSSGSFSRIALEQTDDRALTPVDPPTEPDAYAYQELSRLPTKALPHETRVGLHLYAVVTPAPADGSSPLEELEADAPCKFSATSSGANIRSRPDPESPIIAVMAYRESAEPIARAIGDDSRPWWKLADQIWVRVDATVSGGNCNNLPLIRVAN